MRTIEEVVDILTRELNDAKWDNISLEHVPYGKLLSEILEIHKAEQRPKGEWKYVQYDKNHPAKGNWHCSKCGSIVSKASTAADLVHAYMYCPNCGAEMSVVSYFMEL